MNYHFPIFSLFCLAVAVSADYGVQQDPGYQGVAAPVQVVPIPAPLDYNQPAYTNVVGGVGYGAFFDGFINNYRHRRHRRRRHDSDSSDSDSDSGSHEHHRHHRHYWPGYYGGYEETLSNPFYVPEHRHRRHRRRHHHRRHNRSDSDSDSDSRSSNSNNRSD